MVNLMWEVHIKWHKNIEKRETGKGREGVLRWVEDESYLENDLELELS